MNHPSSPSPKNLIGATLGGAYRLLERVNRGGQTDLYKGIRLADGLPVAVKIPSAGSHAADQLEREYRILRALHHIPNVLHALHFQRSGQWAWLVLEWVQGIDGKTFIEKYSPIYWDTWLWIARSLVSALWSCHTLGTLHMDIKPHNLLLGEDSSFRLADFGISQFEGFVEIDPDARMKGTLFYMPPEQLLDGKVHPPGEVYSVGVTLYEFLTGRPPFQAEDPGEILELKNRGLFTPATRLNPNAAAWVDDLFDRLLQPDPSKRPGGMRELLAMLSHEKVTRWSEKGQLRACDDCGAELWQQLPFCSSCGAVFKIQADEGKCNLSLWQVKDSGLFIQKIEAAAGRKLPPWRRLLLRNVMPRTLMEKVSEPSARIIASFLNDDNTQVHLATGLASRVQTTGLTPLQGFFAIACFLLVEVFWWIGHVGIAAFIPAFLFVMISYNAIAPILPTSFFSPTYKVTQWPYLQKISQMLRRLGRESSRESASLLVRRAKLLYDYLVCARLPVDTREQMANRLGSAVSYALKCLIDMEEKQSSLQELHKHGVFQKKKILKEQLAREQNPQRINDCLARIQELDKSEESILAIEALVLSRETAFANILSTIHGLFLDLSSQQGATLAAFDELSSLIAQGSPEHVSGFS